MTSFDTSRFVEKGQQLQVDVHNFAQSLSTASRTAIEATNPALEGTELGGEWPLTFDLTIEQRLIDMVTFQPGALGKLAVASEESEPPTPQSFMQDKIRNDALEEAYGSETPRQAFALDVVGWVQKMREANWSLLVVIGVQDAWRVELGLYEDTNAARAYFARLTDATHLTEADIAEGAKPYTYLDDQVVVDDPAFAAAVLATQK